jgi:hypothetical protein
MYTHSLAWALDSKENVKTNLRSRISSVGDDLDLAARNGQEKQTKGIPVGPDSSQVLAEIILKDLRVIPRGLAS